MIDRKMFVAAGAAVILAVAAGCSENNTPPASPSPLDSTAGPNGETLKVSAPTLRSPIDGVRTDSTEPVFEISTSTALFTDSPELEYRIQVETMGGDVVYNSLKLASNGGGGTQHAITRGLELDTRYRWKARAEMGSNFGPWSAYAEFLTIDYRGLVPRPDGGNWPRDGAAVVRYISASFPDRLRRTSLEKRVANMQFLRDRIIEAGICGGLDLAHNKKRGTGPHSIDALAWRERNGHVQVMDLASGYDDTSRELRLHWLRVGGAAGYDPMPNHPGC